MSEVRKGQTENCFWVELPDGTWDCVHAERMRIESGAAVFSNGDIFTQEVVAAFAPGGWSYASPSIVGCYSGFFAEAAE